jgi:hypothetical protein
MESFRSISFTRDNRNESWVSCADVEIFNGKT